MTQITEQASQALCLAYPSFLDIAADISGRCLSTADESTQSLIKSLFNRCDEKGGFLNYIQSFLDTLPETGQEQMLRFVNHNLDNPATSWSFGTSDGCSFDSSKVSEATREAFRDMLISWRDNLL